MSDAGQTTQTTTPEQTPDPPASLLTPEPASPAETSLLSPEPTAPAPFDAEKLTLPEEFDKTEANGTYHGFLGLAKDIGLHHEQAQKLIDFHLAEQAKAVDDLSASWTATQTEWINQVKADKEIGNLDTVRTAISKVMSNAKFTDPGFEQALAFTGAGNHPAVIRTLFRWAQALGEGAPVTGSPPARDGNGRLSPAEAIYGPGGPAMGGPRLART